MSTNYSLLLSIAYPNAQWTLYNTEDFTSLVWSSANSIPKPTLDDLNAQLEIRAPAEAIRLLREKRDYLLKESDVYALLDFPHPDEGTRQSWLAYRQALRDLPLTSTPRLTSTLQLDESSVTWPARPTTS